MYTKLDNRTVLKQIVERLDVSEMKQLISFAAGYEAGKNERMPDESTLRLDFEKQNCSAWFEFIGENMEVIKDGETIGRIHDDYCCKDDTEIKKILDNVAQKAYQHLAAKRQPEEWEGQAKWLVVG